MKINKKAESLAGIIIWVFILSITLLGIANIVAFSQESLYEVSQKMNIQSLHSTANTLSEYIDSSSVNVGEDFYIFKNTSTNTFEIFTGTANQNYQNIDKNGEYVDDISTYSGAVYSRIFTLTARENFASGDIDIIDFTLKPVLNR